MNEARLRLKILHVLDHSLPLHSGYTFRSQNIFRSQVQRGWKPVVVTSPKHEANWKEACPAEEVIEGVLYYRSGVSSPSAVPLLGERRLMHRLEHRLSQVVEAEKPDLLHAHSPVLNALPTLRVGRRLGIPVVYEVRAFWEDAAIDHGTYAEGSWKYRVVRSLEARVCRKADQVTVLCQGVKQDLASRGIPAEKMTVIYNGINLDDFQPTQPDAEYADSWQIAGKKVIGFIGSFYRYEGLDLLIEAFAQLTKQRSDIKLLLVGGGEMEAELKELILRRDLASQVLLPGRIPHHRIPGVYALMDVLAYPRYSMRLTELVTPLKPLEAMAMGRALVASDIGGHRELIRHEQSGLLFPANDTDALVKTLQRVLEDVDLRVRLERRGCEWVKLEHSWTKTTSPYSAVYAKALEAS